MTSRYRAIGHSSVDESLFGKPESKNSRSGKLTSTFIPAGSVVLSSSELDKIKTGSIIKTEAQLMREQEEAKKLKEEKEKAARMRKERMKELEILAEKKAAKSDIEIERIARDNAIKNYANEKINENNDVIKLLNSMSARAVAFTIRDQQLAEKERQDHMNREYDQRLDLIMEIDRLKDLQKREEEEKEKREKRISDREVIVQQMRQRERVKILAAEAREQENVAMRNTMKKYQDEDERNAQRRREEIEKSKVEFVKANEEAIRRKKEYREREKQEMEEILIYQAQKDAELSRREQEEAEIAQTKKERQAQLLAQQEKAQNNAEKLDEIRARRAAEERERRVRIKEKEDAIKKKKELDALMEARHKQAEDKRVRQEREKLLFEEEHRDSLDHMAKMKAREDTEVEKKHIMNEKHRTGLQEQIEARRAAREGNRSNNMDEGLRFKQELIGEVAKVDAYRERLLTDLEARGVNPKYLSEMKNVDVAKYINR